MVLRQPIWSEIGGRHGSERLSDRLMVVDRFSPKRSFDPSDS